MDIGSFSEEQVKAHELKESFSKPMNIDDLNVRTEAKYSEAPIKIGFTSLDRMACPLLPGTLLVLAGSPGSRKSFMSLMMHIETVRQGKMAAYLPLEMTRDEHARRIIGLTCSSWAPMDKEDHHRAMIAIDKHGPAASAYTAGVWEVPHQMGENPTPKYVLEWIKQRVDDGYRTVTVDPFSMISWAGGKDQHSHEHDFVCAARSIADSSKATVCIVAHTTKNGETIQGTATLTRIADSVLIMGMYSDHCQVLRPGGARIEEKVDLMTYIDKSRYGSGVGINLAYEFVSDSPTLKEMGIAEMKRKNGRK